ncbi:secretion-regulating guanine nucleotide exchange factor isoform X1 [Venturia canescens]|uniref:secretion-regulating guanine nucleotide exchange factor isoform X1 n=1 Tax=Venturia canescens TaxID=32260 RepID=UPI001C9D47C0|nr:secretion-regulating guanine nucleotide exchange factor isoform X1 [Venturia canescens]
MRRLYAWGANSHGQLGLGFQSELLILPCEIDISSSSLNVKHIKRISGGAGHTLILDERGRAYSCGWNDRGQAGVGSKNEKEVLKFDEINGLENERIKDIACGWNSSMALTEDGQVYVWGSNSHGQLGIKNSKDFKDFREPTKIDYLPERIKHMSMGLRHSAMVTESGKVLITGSGIKSQLGIMDQDNRVIKNFDTFVKIPELNDVAEVVCGQNHTVALTQSGKIFTWGDNRYGQCGFDNDVKSRIDSPSEVKVEGVGKILEIRVGWTHTSALRVDNTLITWGRNNYGQLGYEEDGNRYTWMPTSTFATPKICQFSIGSEHNIAINENRSVYTWGWNEHGNCGDGSTRDVWQPKKVDFPHEGEAILVGSGAGHSFAVVIDKT